MEEIRPILVGLVGGVFLVGLAMLAWSAARSEFLIRNKPRERGAANRKSQSKGEAWIHIEGAGALERDMSTSGMLCLIDEGGFKKGFSVLPSQLENKNSLKHGISLSVIGRTSPRPDQLLAGTLAYFPSAPGTSALRPR